MIRKLTLSEWFLKYQLDNIDKKHNHLNAFIEVDISKILDRFSEDEKKIPMTSILIKACGMWQKKNPEVNKQVFSTFFGKRIYQSDSLSVNVPVILDNQGEQYISITCIKNPNSKTISDIKDELKLFVKTDPKTLPIGRIMIGARNNFWNRIRLKVVHFIINNFISIQDRRGVGTISVSSLLNLNHANTDVTFVARGPGAMSLCICGFDVEKQRMKIGLAWDHATGNGVDGVGAAQDLCRLLQGDRQDEFDELCRLS